MTIISIIFQIKYLLKYEYIIKTHYSRFSGYFTIILGSIDPNLNFIFYLPKSCELNNYQRKTVILCISYNNYDRKFKKYIYCSQFNLHTTILL